MNSGIKLVFLALLLAVAAGCASPAGKRIGLDQALALPDPTMRAMEFGSGLRAEVERNPAGALEYLGKMSHGQEYSMGLRTVLGGMAAKDPDRALLLANQMATNKDQRVVYQVLFEQFARRDPLSATRRLDKVPAGEARVNSVDTIVTVWSEQDMESALAWAKQLKNREDRTVAMTAALHLLSDRDPVRALPLAEEHLEGESLEYVTYRALAVLVDQDVESARLEVERRPHGWAWSRASLLVARAMAEDDPREALAWISTLPKGEQRNGLLNTLDIWARKSPVDAGVYIAQMPAGTDQQTAARQYAERRAESDPADALNWLAQLGNESARKYATIGVAAGWARRDPSAATKWAVALPLDNAAHVPAVEGTMSHWVLIDQEAATMFANALQPGETRDAAFKMLDR
jgi:hypothetical protein